jgi:hypothetical protein
MADTAPAYAIETQALGWHWDRVETGFATVGAARLFAGRIEGDAPIRVVDARTGYAVPGWREAPIGHADLPF